MGTSPSAAQLSLGFYGPFTSASHMTMVAGMVADLDFKKNTDPTLVARFGPPIIQIPNLNPNLTVKLQIGTSNADPNVGVATALDFFIGRNGQDMTVGLIGGQRSSVAMPVASVAAGFKVPQIAFGATSFLLSNKASYPYFLRTVPPDSIQGLALWGWITYFNVPQVVVLFSQEPYGQGLSGAISAIAAQNDQI